MPLLLLLLLQICKAITSIRRTCMINSCWPMLWVALLLLLLLLLPLLLLLLQEVRQAIAFANCVQFMAGSLLL
jgi:hypothetical protein